MISNGSSFDVGGSNLIQQVTEALAYDDKPVFVIIEAAAGFGKTCTAYELLKHFIENRSNLLPFFTELSKNREAEYLSTS
ncbi:MAG: hypothetical protein IPK08_15875 [Bacteroidetes bacterium]|nr:hypothetical protein [Bacteroidota bacterium]